MWYSLVMITSSTTSLYFLLSFLFFFLYSIRIASYIHRWIIRIRRLTCIGFENRAAWLHVYRWIEESNGLTGRDLRLTPELCFCHHCVYSGTTPRCQLAVSGIFQLFHGVHAAL
jgi:hypothetical protein